MFICPIIANVRNKTTTQGFPSFESVKFYLVVSPIEQQVALLYVSSYIVLLDKNFLHCKKISMWNKIKLVGIATVLQHNNSTTSLIKTCRIFHKGSFSL